jgi:hypothetical protein
MLRLFAFIFSVVAAVTIDWGATAQARHGSMSSSCSSAPALSPRLEPL